MVQQGHVCTPLCPLYSRRYAHPAHFHPARAAALGAAPLRVWGCSQYSPTQGQRMGMHPLTPTGVLTRRAAPRSRHMLWLTSASASRSAFRCLAPHGEWGNSQNSQMRNRGGISCSGPGGEALGAEPRRASSKTPGPSNTCRDFGRGGDWFWRPCRRRCCSECTRAFWPRLHTFPPILLSRALRLIVLLCCRMLGQCAGRRASSDQKHAAAALVPYLLPCTPLPALLSFSLLPPPPHPPSSLSCPVYSLLPENTAQQPKQQQM